MTEEQIKNRELVERCPFLLPRNRWTGEILKDYDYSFTELDDMPAGWRKAFGEQMCAEIAESLRQADKLERYRIRQVKEKYGTLRWYDSGGTDETAHIVDRYSALSAQTCCICGASATCVSCEWISPYCDACAHEVKYERFVPIDIWFNEKTKEDES